MTELSIDELASFAKRRGFVFPNSEIYGSLAGFWDYGPLGVELKRNIVNSLWKEFVNSKENVVGIDGSIITHPRVWKASGHIDNFTDPLVQCKKCGLRIRADHLIESDLNISVDGLSLEKMNEIIKKDKLACTKCKGPLTVAKTFNLMFKTHIGPTEEDTNVAYLRPETAQLIFTNFELAQKTSRSKLPFGIAQVGKAFRNEISPRNFLFRAREFDQFEIEFFTHPKKLDECDLEKLENLEVNIYSRKEQTSKKKEIKMKLKDAVKKKIIQTKWHAYWLASFYKWYLDLGISHKNLRLRQHLEEEVSHYASDTWDIEYNFPFGWKEIQGTANRTDFDLQQHSKEAKKDLVYFDEESKEKITPFVIEPSLGIDRAFIAFLTDAYTEEGSEKDKRIVLKLHPKLAPTKVAIFPLVNKDKIPEKAREVFDLLKNDFQCFYDSSGSVGRRYRRMDEAGTPFCITIDHETLEKNTVTIRDRDTMKQKRVDIKTLKDILTKALT